MKLNLDYLLEMLWEYLALTCIYTKKRGRESSNMQPMTQLSLTLPYSLLCSACGTQRVQCPWTACLVAISAFLPSQNWHCPLPH